MMRTFGHKFKGVWIWALMLAMAACCAAAHAETPLRSLAEFEAKAHNSPEVLASVAALDESIGRLDLARADSGWRFFGSFDAGRFREQVDTTAMRTYERIDLRAGLKHPLFGSRHRQEASVAEMNAYSREKAFDQSMARRDSLLALRMHYINYWAAQEKNQLAGLFLQDEASVDPILAHRTATGHLLEGDRREYLSAYALARRHRSQSLTLQQRALGVLSLITGETVSCFQARFPEMPPPCLEAEALAAAVQTSHPMVLRQQEELANQRQVAALAQKSQVNAEVALYSNITSERDASDPGYGIGFNFTFEFPLRSRQAGLARRQSALAALAVSQRELEIVTAKLLMDARESLGKYRTAEKNFKFALQRMAAAREHLRENLLRAAYMPGDGLEQAQQSRLDEYLAAVELVDAWVQRLQAQASLLHFVPAAAPVAVDPTPPERSGYTVYVWRSAGLTAHFDTPGVLLADLRRRGVGRLLISFTAEQISFLGRPDERNRWIAFLKYLQNHGLRVELLMGEPLWILPAHRAHLLDLIRELADLPFSGIHLDLEPDQLPSHAGGETDLGPELMETIEAVKAQTLLPVGLSVHPRYLDPKRRDGGWGGRLSRIGVDEVVLMIYVSNPERTAALAGPVLKAYPNLTFSIAQSLEPELSPAESHARLACPALNNRLDRLSALMPQANFKGIVLQSWTDYEDLCP